MSNEKDKKPNSDAAIQPDPETLHTTDPQDEMKGPISSFMNGMKEKVNDEGRKINPDPDEAQEGK